MSRLRWPLRMPCVALDTVAGTAGGGLVSMGRGMDRGSELTSVRWFVGNRSTISVKHRDCQKGVLSRLLVTLLTDVA